MGLKPTLYGFYVLPDLLADVCHSYWLLRESGLGKPNRRRTCSSLRVEGRGRLAPGLVYRWCSRGSLGQSAFLLA
jgi:hypothetical protein